MKLYVLVGIIAFVLIIAGCEAAPEIDSFEDCVEAGNPILESYPRQCIADGRTFTEENVFQMESRNTMK